MNHSPTPWEVSETFPRKVKQKGGRVIGTFAGVSTSMQRDVENAAFAVHAVNNHDSLVYALRDAAESLKRLPDVEGAYRVTALRQIEIALTDANYER